SISFLEIDLFNGLSRDFAGKKRRSFLAWQRGTADQAQHQTGGRGRASRGHVRASWQCYSAAFYFSEEIVEKSAFPLSRQWFDRQSGGLRLGRHRRWVHPEYLPDIAVRVLDAPTEHESRVLLRIGIGAPAGRGGLGDSRVDRVPVLDRKREQ